MTISKATQEEINAALLYLQKQIDELRRVLEKVLKEK